MKFVATLLFQERIYDQLKLNLVPKGKIEVISGNFNTTMT
jgi:hypothetical protein